MKFEQSNDVLYCRVLGDLVTEADNLTAKGFLQGYPKAIINLDPFMNPILIKACIPGAMCHA
jgi:hypothetical protein